MIHIMVSLEWLADKLPKLDAKGWEAGHVFDRKASRLPAVRLLSCMVNIKSLDVVCRVDDELGYGRADTMALS